MSETNKNPVRGADADRTDDSQATGNRSDERDYGDSAGYGGGGSALDYDEVLGDENSRRDIGPNPLDEVVHTESRRGGAEGAEGGSDKVASKRPSPDSTEALAGPHAKASLTNPEATPGAGALPANDASDEVDPGAG